jgi:putative phosphoribosyl transferase
VFLNRRDAGSRLAESLRGLREENPLVIALPRGGIPVAFEVARALGAPLDMLVVRKLGAPGQPELGVGAVAEGGACVLNEALVSAFHLSPEDIRRLVERESEQVAQRVRQLRGSRPPISAEGRSVILVDDGLATGATARAAVKAIRQQGAVRVILAAPVGSPSTVRSLAAEVDEVVCVEQPERLMAIGEWYEDFSPTSLEEACSLLAEAATLNSASLDVEIPLDGLALPGQLVVPTLAAGVVIFAHGSGSSRNSPRNMAIARTLHEFRIATLLFDLLSDQEAQDRANVFDVELLAGRLRAATRLVGDSQECRHLPVGYFGASTGAAAALWAAAEPDQRIAAVVSRGGRPDLAGERLHLVTAPTLLIVGGRDVPVLALNRDAQCQLRCVNKLEVVPQASHLFEEPGTLEVVGNLARDWFVTHLGEAERHVA